MKAIVCEKYGRPEVLRIKEVQKPSPADNEVLIKVIASTVTKYDCWQRSSTAPPGFWLPSRLGSGLIRPKQTIFGTDAAGEIEVVGKNVKRLKKGDKVFGFSSRLGAHAEYACLHEKGVALKPANMTFEEAASVVQGALTALYFLRKGEIEKGQKILIYGASGGVGSHAVQLAKQLGAEVTGVCSTANVEFVKSLGTDQVIDRKKTDFTKTGQIFNIIFDTVGKTPVSRSIKSLTEGGRYILATFGLPMLIKTLWLLRKSSKKAIFGLVEEKSEELDFLRELIEAGELKAVIDRSYPMEEAAAAHRFVESGQKKGSVVITMRKTEKS